jgi:hypothetical protein
MLRGEGRRRRKIMTHTHLASQLNAALRDGTLGNLADWADSHNCHFDADPTGMVTLVTDGREAARVVPTEDGIGANGFIPCLVPEWARA